MCRCMAEDPLAKIYGEVIAEARARGAPEQALIALGHLYVTGADPSILSERRISIGGQESASLRLFPTTSITSRSATCIARSGSGARSIRYAGAPLALVARRGGYHHQIASSTSRTAELANVRTPACRRRSRSCGSRRAGGVAGRRARRDRSAAAAVARIRRDRTSMSHRARSAGAAAAHRDRGGARGQAAAPGPAPRPSTPATVRRSVIASRAAARGARSARRVRAAVGARSCGAAERRR